MCLNSGFGILGLGVEGVSAFLLWAGVSGVGVRLEVTVGPGQPLRSPASD